MVPYNLRESLPLAMTEVIKRHHPFPARSIHHKATIHTCGFLNEPMICLRTHVLITGVIAGKRNAEGTTSKQPVSSE